MIHGFSVNFIKENSVRNGYLGRRALVIAIGLAAALPALAADLPTAMPDDNLNAVLWDQTSVEAKANALGAYALAHYRLDEALADKSWTAAPAEQTGAFQDLPPAIILDVDDTVLNTSPYQAWNVIRQHQLYAGQLEQIRQRPERTLRSRVPSSSPNMRLRKA